DRNGAGEQHAGRAPRVDSRRACTLEESRARCGHSDEGRLSGSNIHSRPSTGNEVIVLAAKGTVMPMVARRGEWVQVLLSPEIRKTGMLMRWYNNEGSGWVHDS